MSLDFLKDDERLDDLNLDNLKLIQKIDGYGFTSDSVLLANFVKTKHTDICVEIGAGSGIISVLVNYKEKPNKIFAFELQNVHYDLLCRNIELCSMKSSIIPINAKIQDWKNYLQAGSIDVVFSNPPYFKYDEKVCAKNEEKTLSRFDKELSLEDLFDCVSKLLKFGGKFYFVYDVLRMNECFEKMQVNGLMPKRMYFVHPNENKDASVFICEAVKGGKYGLKVFPPLFTNNLDGDYIQTIQKLYKN